MNPRFPAGPCDIYRALLRRPSKIRLAAAVSMLLRCDYADRGIKRMPFALAKRSASLPDTP